MDCEDHCFTLIEYSEVKNEPLEEVPTGTKRKF